MYVHWLTSLRCLRALEQALHASAVLHIRSRPKVVSWYVRFSMRYHTAGTHMGNRGIRMTRWWDLAPTRGSLQRLRAARGKILTRSPPAC